ncbi:nucleoside hydrolase [soil metagenome]
MLAITTTKGNVSARRAADNVARVLELAGRSDIAISAGSDTRYGAHPDLRPAHAIHGADGIGNTGRATPVWEPDPRSAVTLLSETVRAHPDALTLLTLGPLTNIARLLDHDPGVSGLLGQLVAMGGTVVSQGNALPVGEANVAHDPSAAARVASVDWTCPPLLVPLDVTLTATLSSLEFDALASEATPAGKDLHAPLEFYRVFGGTFSPDGESPCHDLTAAVIAHEPHLVQAPLLPFGVDVSGGLAWGTTVVDRRQRFFERAGSTQASPPGLTPWRIALEIDVDATRSRYRTLFLGHDTS